MARTTWDRDEYDETGALMDNTGPHGSGRGAMERLRSELLRKPVIDAAHLQRQRDFSEKTFGPGPRTQGVLDHIRKELVEIEEKPEDLGEWVDVVILALDGAWRAGHGPQEIIDAIIAKQIKNEARTWPDWKTAPEGKAIEHDRSEELRVFGLPVATDENLPPDEIELRNRAGETLARIQTGGLLPGGFVSGRKSEPAESIQPGEWAPVCDCTRLGYLHGYGTDPLCQGYQADKPL